MEIEVTKGKFYNPTKGYLKFKTVIEEIFHFMKEDPEKEYEIVVGCDSSSGEALSGRLPPAHFAPKCPLCRFVRRRYWQSLCLRRRLRRYHSPDSPGA